LPNHKRTPHFFSFSPLFTLFHIPDRVKETRSFVATLFLLHKHAPPLGRNAYASITAAIFWGSQAFFY
jgi:hypothetical protein